MPVEERKPDSTIPSELENNPFVYTCHKKDCGYRVACKSVEAGIHEELYHICPRRIKLQTGRMENMSALTAINEAWELMDAKFDALKKAQAANDSHITQTISNELTGMANVLVLMMRPYYASRDDLVREVVARYASRQAGVEHVTPGIGHIALHPEEGGAPTGKVWGGEGFTSDPAFMETPPVGYPQDKIDAARAREAERRATRAAGTAARASSGTVRPATTKPQAKRQFSEADIEGIKNAHKAGFDHKMILAAYNCTMEDLREILLPA